MTTDTAGLLREALDTLQDADLQTLREVMQLRPDLAKRLRTVMDRALAAQRSEAHVHHYISRGEDGYPPVRCSICGEVPPDLPADSPEREGLRARFEWQMRMLLGGYDLIHASGQIETHVKATVEQLMAAFDRAVVLASPDTGVAERRTCIRSMGHQGLHKGIGGEESRLADTGVADGAGLDATPDVLSKVVSEVLAYGAEPPEYPGLVLVPKAAIEALRGLRGSYAQRVSRRARQALATPAPEEADHAG